MATTTTNFGFDVPTSSDLVKNGATQIALLGQDIDTFLAGGVGFAAGKNKIINGDFNINQRAFTSSTTDGAYGFDRWLMEAASGATYTTQAFSAGAAPVAGYEGKNYAQIATTGQTGAGVYTLLEQKIESVRTFANQTVTVSLFAKGNAGGEKIGIELSQSFGSGGSAQVNTPLGSITLTNAWVRYSLTVAVPSISGKTVGTADSLTLGLWTSAGTTFATRASSIGIQTATIGVWGVQVESGSTKTPFQTATGTIQGESAACQRYFNRFTSGPITLGNYFSNTRVLTPVPLPVSMRIAPTGITSNSAAFTTYVAGSGRASSAVAFNSATTKVLELDITSAADVLGRVGSVTLDSGSFDVSAEL